MAISVVSAIERALELSKLAQRCKNLDAVACARLLDKARVLLRKGVSRLGRRPNRRK